MTSSTNSSRMGGFALLLFFATTAIELFAVAIASAGFDEVADASPFGRSGTILVAAAAAGIACIGAIVAWRGSSGALRTVLATVVFVAVGMIALLGWFFVVAGGTPIILAVLLAHVAVSLGIIGRAVLRSAPLRTGS